jgi:hypothetical protein
MNLNPKWDNVKLGIVIGTLAPALGVMVYYFVHQAIPSANIRGLSYSGYLEALQSPKMLSTILRGSLLMNLIAFAIAMQLEFIKVVQGIVGMTLAYGFIIVILHLL